MKKTFFFIAILFIGVAAYFVYDYWQAGGPETITFVKLEKVKFSDVQLPPNMSVTFASDVVLNNPNPFGVEVSKMDFDVFVDGNFSTHISQNQGIQIPASATFALPLEFRIPLKEKELFKGIKDVISGAWKKKAIEIRAEGNIYVKAIRTPLKIPFSHSETYKLKDYLK